MANPIKGEVDFVVGLKTYTFKLGHNARATAEGLLGKPLRLIVAELSDIENLTHETVRGLVFAGLHQHQPELSLFDVGDLMDEVGDEYVGEVLKQAFELSAPKADPSRPPKTKQKRAGTTR